MIPKLAFQALELHEDLKFWALNGYGNPLNSDMACPLINDLVDTFVNISSDGTKGVFYVSDSDAFLPFLSLLGLFNDSQPLIGPNYNNSLKDRAYRTSTMSPFAANIAFVFFDCDEHEDKVVVLHNETPVKLEACSTPHCTWSQFKAIFQVSQGFHVFHNHIKRFSNYGFLLQISFLQRLKLNKSICFFSGSHRMRFQREVFHPSKWWRFLVKIQHQFKLDLECLNRIELFAHVHLKAML